MSQGPVFFQRYGRNNFYFEAFQIIIKNLGNYFDENSKAIITKTSICNSKKSNLINAQQIKISESSKNFFILDNTDNLDNNYRYDKCHLNEIGTDTTARSIADIINLF